MRVRALRRPGSPSKASSTRTTASPVSLSRTSASGSSEAAFHEKLTLPSCSASMRTARRYMLAERSDFAWMTQRPSAKPGE